LLSEVEASLDFDSTTGVK